jgi:hypothetical protein
VIKFLGSLKLISVAKIATLALCIFVSACGSSDLSRSDAAEKISEGTEITLKKTEIPILKDALSNGVAQAVWTIENNTILLHDKISKEISYIDQAHMTLIYPTDVSVEVTGIADIAPQENVKKVQFDWTYKDLPNLSKRFAVAGGTGEAVFRLYDDGWRLEKTEIMQGDQPVQLNDAERNDLANDFTQEAERLRLESEAKQKVVEARESAILQSKTATRKIGSYKYTAFRFGRSQKDSYPGTITLTDVGFTLSNEHQYSKSSPVTYLFYDGFIPSGQDCCNLKYGQLAGQKYKIAISPKDFKSATWGWSEPQLLFRPFLRYEISFADASERDRFAADANMAVDKWLQNHSALVKQDGEW